MDYEKKYKEALERAKVIYQGSYKPDTAATIAETLQNVFPELCESEDERIRKELIEHVKDQQSSFISAPDCRDKYEEEENNKYNSWLAWLEKQGKQKPAWSEEDEKKLRGICNYISCSDSPEGFEEWIDWLNSLKDRYTWKPSEEQMDALNSARWNAPFKIEILDSLYNDLKKLTE